MRGFASLCSISVFLGLLVAATPARADDTSCPYHKITWDDFKGPAPTGTEDAEITTGTSSSWETDTPKMAGGGWTCKLKNVKVSAIMDKTKSGVKDGKKTDALLEHEQYHFDISQYWARELEKALNDVKGTGATAAEAEADAEAKGNAAEADAKAKCDALQEQYDTETEHGTNEDKQKEWCKKIGNLLTPGPADTDKGKAPGSQGNYEPGVNELRFENVNLQQFDTLGTPFNDPYLFGAQVILPPLHFMGFHMGTKKPRMMPNELAPQMMIQSVHGPAMVANLRLALGKKNKLRGWLEEIQINPVALQQSPLLQRIQKNLRKGDFVVSISILLPDNIEILTNNFTMPTAFPAQVDIGTRKEPMAP